MSVPACPVECEITARSHGSSAATAAPARLPAEQFEVAAAAAPVGSNQSPRLASKEAFASPDGAVSTGTWEATLGSFARAP